MLNELNKVYTNGTLVNGDLLIYNEAGHCISIREDAEANAFGLRVLDSATSQLDLNEFEDDISRTKLEKIMHQLGPQGDCIDQGPEFLTF